MELLVFLSYEFGREAARFYPILGVQSGYLLSARVSDSSIGGAPSTVNPFASSSEVYRYELGFSIGVGSQFRVSPNASVFLDVRYASGLTNIWKSANHLFSGQDGFYPAYYNTGLSLNTGVLF